MMTEEKIKEIKKRKKTIREGIAQYKVRMQQADGDRFDPTV